ncbi:LacI family DNA-binding transcriptional regulator [Lachnobacterium bovis]|uniref:LacI family DNA-binding transcriptional regulator n=1 Tax=Lachnobacterium bovis TaxID=140626 RepID=UPI0003B59E66|nr:LacI family DNA-binding transcriptional regulator [Lachnobacterium bovis]
MNVTITDVAKLAGVSPSTVSRVIADNPSISIKTKNKVKNAIEQLGYAGKPLKNKKRNFLKTIGVVINTDIGENDANSFILNAILGINYYCNQNGFSTILISNNNHEGIINEIKRLYSYDALDGIIFPYSTIQNKVISYLKNHDLPFTMIGKPEDDNDAIFYIDNDNIMAARQGTNYLINLGHSKIAYIGAGNSLVYSNDRKSGYFLALAEHGIQINPNYIIDYDTNDNFINEKIQNLLAGNNPPTALLACDDTYAMIVTKAAIACGLNVPNDLSIVSFNNSALAVFSTPTLTSIDINSKQLGIEAASQLINYIKNPLQKKTKIIVPHQLIERNSCKKI